MRAMGGRPVLLQRFPNGAGGPSFFQKRVPDSRPEWLETTIVSTPNGTTSQALVAADLAHVLWAVNLGCLGFHVWPSNAADPEHSDELRIDLDPTPGCHLRHGPGGRARGSCADGRARRRVHAQDNRQPRDPCVRAPAAALDRLRGAVRCGCRRARARTAPAGARHGGVVEGGARPPGLRRLQPERTAQDDLRRVVGARPAGRSGVDTLCVGGARRRPPRRVHHRNSPAARGTRPRPMGADGRGAPVTPADPRPAHTRRGRGVPDAPWPPQYPKMPGELPRVAPSRARKVDPATD